MRFGVKSWIRICIEAEIQELSRLKMEPQRAVDPDAQNEVWRLKIETLRVCRPVVADSHHLDEEQDPDLDPH
jgi:hypothetical protein